MCGIFGYIGEKNAVTICLDGLKKLEYRGYDSSGIAGIVQGKIACYKEVGKISSLEESLLNKNLFFSLGIAHTRWATHGVPSKKNAHPHLDQKGVIAVVHNGVIENYASLKQSLEKDKKVSFVSDTDTEVIAQLMGDLYAGDFLKTALNAFSLLEGSFAVAAIHKDFPDQMIATAKESPLVVGVSLDQTETFVASDPSALAGQELEIFFLTDGEVAFLQRNKKPIFFNKKGNEITKYGIIQNLPENAVAKGQFEHFMLKEIFEQPRVIKDVLVDKFDEKNNNVSFDEITFDTKIFKEISNILIIACGTSWHAAYIGAYALEQYTKIPTRAEIASEFRYKHMMIPPKTLVIVMSQSGETADTIAGLREAKRQGATTLALCNVKGSTIVREADSTLFLKAGPEVAVASTKTFTAQVILLLLLTLRVARDRSLLNEEQGRLFFNKLYELPEQVAEVLSNSESVQVLAKKYAKSEDFFFLGRGLLYPTALEAALKVKEIAYINATGYPAGEMKHGPIAFLDEEVPVFIFLANKELHQKIMSNLMESKARKAPVIAIGWKQFEKDILGHVNDVLWIPKTDDILACIPITVATQLFAYFLAKERKRNIDQPRNLAKSVTVE